MASNVIDEAAHDAAQFASDHDASKLGQKLAAHHSKLYQAELVGLLVRQGKLEEVKKALSGGASHAHDVTDADKKDHDANPKTKDRADSVPALEHKVVAKQSDAAVDALKDGEHHYKEVEKAAQDGKALAGKSLDKIKQELNITAMSGQSAELGLEREMYELKIAGKLGALKGVNPTESRLFLGQAAAMAERDGLISGGDVVANSKGADDELPMQAASFMGDPVRSAQHRLQKAEEKIRTLEEQLHLALQEISPVIADENKAADDIGSVDNKRIKTFITTYRASPEYKAAEFELAQARGALGLELKSNESNLADHAADKDHPDVARYAHKTILDSYMSMASSDDPKQALEWVKAHENDPAYTNPADKKQLKTIEQAADDTVASIAMTNLKAIFDSGEADGTKFDRASEYVEKHIVVPYEGFDKLHELAKIPELLKKQKVVWELHKAKDAEAAMSIAKAFIKESAGEATIAKRINTFLGTALLGLGNAQALKGGDALLKRGAEIRDFYAKGKELRELLHRGEEATNVEKAAKLAKDVRGSYMTLSHGIGALALVGDVYAISEDWNQLHESPFAYGKLAGDLISTVGDTMVMIPGLEPIGEAISIVGAAISLIAGAFIGDAVGDARRKATRETLVDGGLLDDKKAKVVTNDDAAGNMKYAATLTGNAALSPEQLQTLAGTHEELFKDSHMIEAAHAAWRWYIGNKDRAGFELQSPYRDSFMEFLMGADGGKWKLSLLYIRPSCHGGTFTSDGGGYGDVGMMQIREAFPKGAFKS